MTGQSSATNNSCSEDKQFNIEEPVNAKHDFVDNDNTESKRFSYTREQKFILLAACTGNFFAFSCASLPSPFLPLLVCNDPKTLSIKYYCKFGIVFRNNIM